MTDASGRMGIYTRTKLIGQGPHADVWQADGPSACVALKVATTDQGRAMLQHEARVLDSLHHPGIVTLEARDPDGLWLALELIDGGPIDAWASGRSHREIAMALAQVAEALAFMHAHGVVHGDLKPSNVLVGRDGNAHIIDLGVAWATDAPATAGFRGTLGFAAPEQLQGAGPSLSTDMYALGALSYAVITGRPPFQASDPTALAVLPLQTLPLPPAATVPELPQQLGELVLRMLARSPHNRPSDASLVAGALRSCAEGTPGSVLLGMFRTREALRRLVVRALDGQPVTVVVHGSSGSGRSALIREATAAAQREGMQMVRIQAGADATTAVDTIVAESQRQASVVILDARMPQVPTIAARLYAGRVPALILIRSDRPLPALLSLGARHVSPVPLSLHETELLMVHLGHDPAQAAELHKLSGGRPGALKTLLGRDALPSDISGRERDILLAASRGPAAIIDLARRLNMKEHDLLDIVEPLLDRGLLTETRDGTSVECMG
ncbi:MAG: serine/threonine-protein kinase PknK [Oligoflexia bacterium]|nr:serine/threonine-protein kinase PknK [Oligoflexia bacterium]